jgi:hypothetical protein
MLEQLRNDKVVRRFRSHAMIIVILHFSVWHNSLLILLGDELIESHAGEAIMIAESE